MHRERAAGRSGIRQRRQSRVPRFGELREVAAPASVVNTIISLRDGALDLRRRDIALRTSLAASGLRRRDVFQIAPDAARFATLAHRLAKLIASRRRRARCGRPDKRSKAADLTCERYPPYCRLANVLLGRRRLGARHCRSGSASHRRCSRRRPCVGSAPSSARNCQASSADLSRAADRRPRYSAPRGHEHVTKIDKAIVQNVVGRQWRVDTRALQHGARECQPCLIVDLCRAARSSDLRRSRFDVLQILVAGALPGRHRNPFGVKHGDRRIERGRARVGGDNFADPLATNGSAPPKISPMPAHGWRRIALAASSCNPASLRRPEHRRAFPPTPAPIAALSRTPAPCAAASIGPNGSARPVAVSPAALALTSGAERRLIPVF